MTVFYLNPCDLNKWMYQNDAEYLGDFVPGCLQDNFTVITKRGYAAIYEHYVNEWNSDFRVEFQPFNDQYASYDVITEFYNFESEYERKYGEIE